jgi:hypothetical protein
VARDPTGTSGLEWGHYTWNEGTGGLSLDFGVNTDGEWGLSHSGVTSATVADNVLTLYGPEGSFSISRLMSPPDSLVGSWYGAPSDGGSDQVVFTFLPDGTRTRSQVRPAQTRFSPLTATIRSPVAVATTR